MVGLSGGLFFSLFLAETERIMSFTVMCSKVAA